VKVSIRPAGDGHTGLYRWFVETEHGKADGWARSVRRAKREIRRAAKLLREWQDGGA